MRRRYIEVDHEADKGQGDDARHPERRTELPLGFPPAKRKQVPLLWVSASTCALIGFVVLPLCNARAHPAATGGDPAAVAADGPSSCQRRRDRYSSHGHAVRLALRPPRSCSKTLVIDLTAPHGCGSAFDLGNVSLLEGTFPAGTTKTFHGNAALVRVGNAGGEITGAGRGPVPRATSSKKVLNCWEPTLLAMPPSMLCRESTSKNWITR